MVNGILLWKIIITLESNYLVRFAQVKIVMNTKMKRTYIEYVYSILVMDQ